MLKVFSGIKWAIIVTILLLKTTVLAQDFEVAPITLNFAVEPGDMESQIITVRNHGNKPQSFVLSLGDMQKNRDGKSVKVAPGSTKRSCANWITLNPSYFELAPNEAKEIEVLMQVPPSGESSRWGVIYVKTAREQSALEVDKIVAAGITVSPRIVVNVYQSPGSNAKYFAKISKLVEISKPQDSLRVFNVEIENTGDNRIDCKLYLVASNLETASESKTNPVRITMLPEEIRTVELKLPADLLPGPYSVAAILDYGHRTNLEAVQM
ncbi:MAG TPA: hypothetical protein EYN69_06840 [Flavobacteriales bacterium]|nr:hypothetical protein [Flavobacteriales bacterium]